MAALQPQADPIDIPEGATIRRPDPNRPFVAMSNRKRWSKCALSAVLPQLRTPSGPSAEAGTEVHKVAEWALHRQFKSANVSDTPPAIIPPPGLEGFDYSDRGIADWQATALKNAQTYATNAASLFANAPGPTVCMVELKIEDVTIHGVRVFTVADGMFWNPSVKRLVSGDYKNGRMPVGAGTVEEPNEQCAGGLVLWVDQAPHLQPEQVGVFVYQPNTMYGEPWQVVAVTEPAAARAWIDTERQKLHRELASVAAAASAMARGELVDPTPGDHCKYCPSARWCPAAAGYGAMALDVEANRVAVVDLTPEEVMSFWASRSAFKQWEEDLRERVKILHEKNHPAVQVKRRIGNRIWSSPQATVEALMLADRFDLLMPPGIEKAEAVLTKADMDALITRAPDVLTYVAADGKNPTMASEAFAKYLTKENK